MAMVGQKYVRLEKRRFAQKMRHNPTPPEAMLWEYLKSKQTGYKFRRQHILYGWIVDFCCPLKKVIIEVDGAFHRERGQYQRDLERDQRLTELGYTIIRVPAWNVFNKIEDTVDRIRQFLDRKD
jgi:very-short-patch-repair endonuclease